MSIIIYCIFGKDNKIYVESSFEHDSLLKIANALDSSQNGCYTACVKFAFLYIVP